MSTLTTEPTIAASRRPTWREVLSREEIDSLLEIRDWRGWLALATNWAIVAAAFWLVAWTPNPLTVVAALFVLGKLRGEDFEGDLAVQLRILGQIDIAHSS